MRRYETLMVLHPELPEAQVRETIDRARRLIDDAGGQMHGHAGMGNARARVSDPQARPRLLRPGGVRRHGRRSCGSSSAP